MPAGWYLRTDTVWAFVIEFGGEFEGVEIMKKYLLANFDFFPKLRTAVYPSNKARIGAKLWENAFRTICNFSFFDAQKNFFDKTFAKKIGVDFKKVRFWRGYEFLIRDGRCVVKSYYL